MSREIRNHQVNGCNDAITIEAIDAPGSGGANHEYRITFPTPSGPCKGEPSVTYVNFQNGPIGEVGTNGLTHEVLLTICIDRLQAFQRGPYACRENALALTKLEEAMMWLKHRTEQRLARGVEGTHKI